MINHAFKATLKKLLLLCYNFIKKKRKDLNLYILTEERPKQEVLHTIITRFLQDKKFCVFIDTLKILPVVKDNCFTFSYEILGVSCKDIIFISARLFKANTLSHDPNIGAISGICAALRKLGFKENLTITHHGLEQKHLGKNNKFIQIANVLHIDLDGLTIPKAKLPQTYWHYETQGEKLATIFIHLVVEHFSNAYGIFENHAGCEKSYFLTADGNYIVLQKYEDKQSYKQGNKKARLFIPDLILLDPKNLEIINIESKKYINKESKN